ncbi:MAG: hypothetical protein AAF468_20055 [Pseudomonadota bacterium]
MTTRPGRLSIDPSTRPGWAVYHPEYGYRWERAKIEGKGAWRTINFRRHFVKIIDMYDIGLVAVELPPPNPNIQRSEAALEAIYTLSGAAKEVPLLKGLPEAITYLPTQWRSKFFPSGWMKVPDELKNDEQRRRRRLKDLAISECQKRGWDVKYDDEADALGILEALRIDTEPGYGFEHGRSGKHQVEMFA